jgi:hypothetical protein
MVGMLFDAIADPFEFKVEIFHAKESQGIIDI